MKRPLRVLFTHEFSGVGRRAFRALGHEAWSCDLLPAEDCSDYHLRMDAIHVLRAEGYLTGVTGIRCFGNWDLIISHPPCTFLCNSGVRWLYRNGRGHEHDELRWANMRIAATHFAGVWQACGKIPHCLENPTMHGYAQMEIDRLSHSTVPFGQHPDVQRIDPRDFGHMETKLTGLHLFGLPHLKPTKIVRNEAALLTKAERSRVHYASPGPDRWKERSRTLPGIAAAMAEQWSEYLLSK